ncbi:hypothetical protein BDR07DRAFT_1195483, partial [Suillus spraguei]
IYKLFTSSIVPPPIALVTMISDYGVENLAPFWLATHLLSNFDNLFPCVTNDPPVISFECNHSTPGRLKYTVANVKISRRSTI